MPRPGVCLLAALADRENLSIHRWLGKAMREGFISSKTPYIAGHQLALKLGKEASQDIIAAYLRKIDAEEVQAELIREFCSPLQQP